jgi:hypothetical protein
VSKRLGAPYPSGPSKDQVTDARGAPYTLQWHVGDSDWLDQFEEGNAAGGHAGEVEATPRLAASPSMTSRRFPAPRRADKMPGGYVVRDANGQALAYITREIRNRSAASEDADVRRRPASRAMPTKRIP